MLLAAWNEGVGASPNAITDEPAARAALGLEDEERIAIILSFGYPAKKRDPSRDRRRSGARVPGAARSRRASDGNNRSVKEILPEIERWQEAGEQVVVATVIASRRSSPRPVGSSLAISGSGKLCGSVSGGCVEGDVFQEAQEVLETGAPKLLSYGISDEQAWAVGLPCGGEIDVFVERLP